MASSNTLHEPQTQSSFSKIQTENQNEQPILSEIEATSNFQNEVHTNDTNESVVEKPNIDRFDFDDSSKKNSSGLLKITRSVLVFLNALVSSEI